MCLAGQLNALGITAKKSFNVIQMFQYGGAIPLLFVNLVPLVVVVENQRDDFVEIRNESVVRSIVHQTVEPFVQIGEVLVVS